MQRQWLIGFGLLVWTSVPMDGSAEQYVIYRKIDGVVTSWTNSIQNARVEVQNAVRSSSLGGTEGDYAILTLSDEIWHAQQGRPLRVTNGQVERETPVESDEPVEIPLESFGAGMAGALAALGGRRLVLLARKSKSS